MRFYVTYNGSAVIEADNIEEAERIAYTTSPDSYEVEEIFEDE